MSATFRVGQRVRIIWSEGYPELAGEEGVIEGRENITIGSMKGRRGWSVAPDCWGTSQGPDGDYFVPLGDQLEPLTDHNMKIEWCDCIWQPEHLRVQA
jgi:hypothetical protein